MLCQAPPSVQEHFPQKVYCGKEVGNQFISSLLEIKDKIDHLKKIKDKNKDVANMHEMTKEEKKCYDNATHCYICKKKITYNKSVQQFTESLDKDNWNETDKLGPKVRDHGIYIYIYIEIDFFISRSLEFFVPRTFSLNLQCQLP